MIVKPLANDPAPALIVVLPTYASACAIVANGLAGEAESHTESVDAEAETYSVELAANGGDELSMV